LQLIWTILIGLMAGVLAKLITSGTGPGGLGVRTALGVAGALIATYLGQAVGLYRTGESGGFLGALLGAIVLLVIHHVFTKTAR
jgi:uncharacterized membrane protein YeaQ/YmgE (transglycosylase-associated protein family)